MNLAEFQRAVFEVTRQPLTPSEKVRPRLPDGRSARQIANALVKPNDRLTSFERLQIYNQQYWFRIRASLGEDFPGLRSLIGEWRFEKLAVAYLNECPSQSFTLRDLGARLEAWLGAHREFVAGVERMALDMVRLEWAQIEAFDGGELPRFARDDLSKLSGRTRFRLQPHLRLLELSYPVDDLLLRGRESEHAPTMASNAVLEFPGKSGARRVPLPKPQRVFLVVYRLNGSVYFKRLTRPAFALVRALGEGKSLARALETALRPARRGAAPCRDQVREWFENWAALGWFAK